MGPRAEHSGLAIFGLTEPYTPSALYLFFVPDRDDKILPVKPNSTLGRSVSDFWFAETASFG